MNIRLFPSAWLAVCLVLSGAQSAAAFAPGPTAEQYRSLIDERASAIVTVKAVLEMEVRAMGQVQRDEERVEASGAVVDASGLVLVSGTKFSADRLMQMFGGAMAQGVDIRAEPTDIRVIIEGDEERSFDAFLVATDPDLDLAFIQIEELGDEEDLAVIDLADAERVDVGDHVLLLSRLGTGYDYAPHVETGRIGGSVRRPRRASTVDGMVYGMGLPAFNPDGQVVGILTTLVTDEQESPGGMGMMRMMGGESPIRTFIVPTRMVRTLKQGALEEAARMLEERSE